MSDQIALPRFTDDEDFRDLLEPAMRIARAGDREAAEEFVRRYVEHLRDRHPDWSEERAREVVMRNVGYWAGYHDRETMRAVQDVFGAVHPVFGATPPQSPEEAFEAGQQWARASISEGPNE